MNEQLQQALADIIQRATTGIDSAAAFLVAELPDVVYQLLLWYSVKSALLCAFGVIMLVLSAWFLKRHCGKGEVISHFSDGTVKERMATFTHNSCGIAHDGIVAVMIAVPLIVFIASNLVIFNMDWLQILIAPKIWLIEYAAHLVK